MNKKMIVITFILLTCVAASIVAYTAISNVLGPYKIHVLSETSQLLVISSPGPSATNITKGATVEIPITVENRGDSAVNGYVAVIVTSNDTSFSSNDVKIVLRSSNFAGHTYSQFGVHENLANGYVYRSGLQFTFDPGCREEATLYITFNRENMNPDGYYEVKVLIISG